MHSLAHLYYYLRFLRFLYFDDVPTAMVHWKVCYCYCPVVAVFVLRDDGVQHPTFAVAAVAAAAAAVAAVAAFVAAVAIVAVVVVAVVIAA